MSATAKRTPRSLHSIKGLLLLLLLLLVEGVGVDDVAGVGVVVEEDEEEGPAVCVVVAPAWLRSNDRLLLLVLLQSRPAKGKKSERTNAKEA